MRSRKPNGQGQTKSKPSQLEVTNNQMAERPSLSAPNGRRTALNGRETAANGRRAARNMALDLCPEGAPSEPRAPQMKLPLVGRVPHIGTEIPQMEFSPFRENPQSGQDQRAMVCTPGLITLSGGWRGWVVTLQTPSSWSSRVVSSEWKSGQRGQDEGVPSTKGVFAAARAAFPVLCLGFGVPQPREEAGWDQGTALQQGMPGLECFP